MICAQMVVFFGNRIRIEENGPHVKNKCAAAEATSLRCVPFLAVSVGKRSASAAMPDYILLPCFNTI